MAMPHTLTDLTTFKIPAQAQQYAEIANTYELQTLLKSADSAVFILGGGSNTIFVDDFPGLVIKLTENAIRIVKEDTEHVQLEIAAGTPWHDVVMYCVEHEYYGIENLALIPGNTGAAPIQNIGAYGVELVDVFTHLDAIHITTGEHKRFNKSDCQFAYRDSIFKGELKGQYAIVAVSITLAKQAELNLDYGDIRQTLVERNITSPTIKDVADVVMAIRQRKLPDPATIANAGSFFRNPIIDSNQAQTLKEHYPNLPMFAQPNTSRMKLSAAWLIEQCGWKGKCLKHVGVYDNHALVLVNHGGATAAELQELITAIQDDVAKTFGVTLTPEVNLIALPTAPQTRNTMS